MPDAILSAAFEQDVEGTDVEGAGIGLFLVATLTDRHDGDIWIDDDADSPGATFRVRLPRVTLGLRHALDIPLISTRQIGDKEF